MRIAILKNGTTKLDKNYSFGGRGIYIHNSSIKIGFEKDILKNQIKKFDGDYNSISDELVKEMNKYGEKNK